MLEIVGRGLLIFGVIALAKYVGAVVYASIRARAAAQRRRRAIAFAISLRARDMRARSAAQLREKDQGVN